MNQSLEKYLFMLLKQKQSDTPYSPEMIKELNDSFKSLTDNDKEQVGNLPTELHWIWTFLQDGITIDDLFDKEKYTFSDDILKFVNDFKEYFTKKEVSEDFKKMFELIIGEKYDDFISKIPKP